MVHSGQLFQPFARNEAILSDGLVAHSHPATANHPARPPFAHPVLRHQMRDRLPLSGIRHHFFSQEILQGCIVEHRIGQQASDQTPEKSLYISCDIPPTAAPPPQVSVESQRQVAYGLDLLRTIGDLALPPSLRYPKAVFAGVAMLTVTLLASPSRADLGADLIRSLRDRWQGGQIVELAQGVAAEFRLPTLPDDFWQAWAELQQQGFDLAIQPTATRRKSILLADMDSTMINQECIDELADFAGVGARVADITARAMNGELNFHEALIERVGLLAGLAEDAIDKVLDQRITLASGGLELVATMRDQGAYTALVSGGFTDFTGPVAKALGFDEHRANLLLSNDGVLTGHVGLPVLGREAKIEALEQISATRGTTPEDAIAVGDGANDLGMLQLAGTGVALHAKSSVAAQVDIRINHGDLTALLYLQGYGRDEFVT